MTAQAELLKDAHSMGYALCIEGIGWPIGETSSYGGSASGFAGNLFVVDDLNGDMATKLAGSETPTIRKGLGLPNAIGDSFDPATLQYKNDGINFDIVDDGFILSSVTGQRTPNEMLVSTAFAYQTVDLILKVTTGGSHVFASADVVWIGGRELVKLGTKSGAGPYTYTGCTRGYLGTPRGRLDRVLIGDDGMTWTAETSVQSVGRFLHDRRVRLYGHVPGESASHGACVLLYTGRLRGMTSDKGATRYRFTSSGEQVGSLNRSRFSATGWALTGTEYLDLNNRIAYPQWPACGGEPDGQSANYRHFRVDGVHVKGSWHLGVETERPGSDRRLCL
jgi:hypothetical protein